MSVRVFVRPSLFLFLELFSSPFKSFNGVSRNIKRYLKFTGCFNEVSRRFLRSLRVFSVSVKGVSRNFKGCFKEVSRVFQGNLKGMS